MRKLLEDAAERGIRYLETLDERPVAPSSSAVERLETLRIPLPAHPTDPREVLRELDEVCSPATVAMAGRRFFGFVIGGALPATLAANWLAGAWDNPTGLYSVTPATGTLEEVALGWLLDIFGLPEGAAGSFVTGATVANFTALAAARNRILNNVGWNVEADGLIGAPPINVVMSEESHPTVYKSIGMLGLGRHRVHRVPTDAQGRMRADLLPQAEGPTIVCTQAGNVNTGAFDPIGEVCERLQNTNAWIHVDGAFGLWAAANPSHAHLTAGMERADSWATDAHKWLNVPYDSGIALVRDPEPLRAAMAITAEYLPTASDRRNPSDFTPELSRRGRGIEVWAALKSLGRTGVADLVERCCGHARRFAAGLSAAGYPILNEVVLNQVLVAFGDAETSRRVIAAVQRDGTCWCGGTVWQGKPAMRISVSSWATTDEDVEMSLAAIIRQAREYGA
jgi:glutamate/tyrosine decarboxylase-like PLP-dependent enzyme